MNQLFRVTLLLGLFVLCAGCATRPYVYETDDLAPLRQRAETQSEGPVSVSAAVAGREEAHKIFGVDLYDDGIQPVWIEIRNSGTAPLRYAPVSTDRFYYSPLEVSYKNRKGFSADARAAMDDRFMRMSVSRFIEAGETVSGFVFTHSRKGAKGFNVDVFGIDENYVFTFLLRVPGFVPDYAEFDREDIYPGLEYPDKSTDEIVSVLRDLPCCNDDVNGEASGDPLNLIVIASGPVLLSALLRSNWQETSIEESASEQPHFLFGRKQDGIFRYQSIGGESLYEFRAWLAPFTYEQTPVWIGQVRHYYTRGAFERADPDVDNARNFSLQNFLYSQALKQVAYVMGPEVIPVDTLWEQLFGRSWFTDGTRAVVWLSDEPQAMQDIGILDWDDMPGWIGK